MAIGWGALLPWGVAIANRTKKVSGAAPGAWFKLHRRFQVAGWTVQLVGFGMAVWHVQSLHFTKPHHLIGLIAVVLGTLQPFNAALRKFCAHPHEGEPKTAGRLVFEVVHKGSGYIATVMGMVNCWIGVLLLVKGEYDVAAIAVAAALTASGTLSVVSYVIISCLCPDNCISKTLVGGSYKVDSSDGKMDA
mmetsp:Transcript_33700/g.59681  ORF Transcript_33700/g.59681 Transcript_33700/m.59681 type:complete len:191 (-) Transcript_33700:107-679(-)